MCAAPWICLGGPLSVGPGLSNGSSPIPMLWIYLDTSPSMQSGNKRIYPSPFFITDLVPIPPTCPIPEAWLNCQRMFSATVSTNPAEEWYIWLFHAGSDPRANCGFGFYSQSHALFRHRSSASLTSPTPTDRLAQNLTHRTNTCLWLWLCPRLCARARYFFRGTNQINHHRPQFRTTKIEPRTREGNIPRPTANQLDRRGSS
jgi:hypothetical protein